MHDQKLISGKLSDDNERFPLPLGWFLSEASQTFIRQQIGGDKDCSDELNKTTHNNCVFRSIKEELSVDPLLRKKMLINYRRRSFQVERFYKAIVRGLWQ